MSAIINPINILCVFILSYPVGLTCSCLFLLLALLLRFRVCPLPCCCCYRRAGSLHNGNNNGDDNYTNSTTVSYRWPGSPPASGLCTWTTHLTPGEGMWTNIRCVSQVEKVEGKPEPLLYVEHAETIRIFGGAVVMEFRSTS